MSLRKWKETEVEDLIRILESEYPEATKRHKIVSFLMQRFSQKLNPHKAFKAADRFLHTKL